MAIGALDCTHVKIRSPGGDNAEMYRNQCRVNEYAAWGQILKCHPLQTCTHHKKNNVQNNSVKIV